LKTKINELADVKNSTIDLENSIKENKNSIKEISNGQIKIFNKIEEISSNNNNKLEIISKIYDEINSNSTKNHEMYLEMKENIKTLQNSLSNIKDEISLVKDNQKQIKTNIEKKQKETDLMIKKQANLEESNKNDINELKKEIDFLKNDMGKKIEDLTKKIEKMGEKKEEKENRLKIEKKKKEEKEYIKLKNCLNNPQYFKYDELISKDLFTKNYYNNRACIFNSFKYKKIYIAFGDRKSFNLECYDVLDSKKFTIIKKLHEQSFNSCRYYYNKNEKLDLLITSSLDNRVKIINFKKEKSEILINLAYKSEEKIIINTAFFVDDLIMIPFSSRMNGTVYFYEPHYKSETKYKFIDKIDSNSGFISGLNSCYCKFNYYVLVAN
jgi:DNA repair exonuclease SbcCD ATPase subunit